MVAAGDNASTDALTAEADRAFDRGDHRHGLDLLRRAAAGSSDSALLHRLAVVEEQIGTQQLALAAHFRCLALAPNNPLAYLYAGYSLQQQGRTNDALNVLSLGSDLDPTLLAAAIPEEPSPTVQRKQLSRVLLRRHFSELHRAAVGADEGLARVRESVWTRTHDQPFEPPRSGQQPQFFYLPGLTPIRFADTAAWPWATALQSRSQDIIAEYRSAQSRVESMGRPYLDSANFTGGDFDELAGSHNWTALDLYRNGSRNDALCQHFPRTLEALAQVPLYGMDRNPYEVFFSVLRAGQHIKPHYGLSNHSLTVHLPIITPESCQLVVDGESRSWSAGQLLAFDDTFLHEAVNASNEDRVVLIFSVWHPELTLAEREAVQRSFNRRSAWLAARSLPPGVEQGH